MGYFLKGHTNPTLPTIKTKAGRISWCLCLSWKWLGHLHLSDLDTCINFTLVLMRNVWSPHGQSVLYVAVFKKYKAGWKPSQKSMIWTQDPGKHPLCPSQRLRFVSSASQTLPQRHVKEQSSSRFMTACLPLSEGPRIPPFHSQRSRQL